LFKALCLLTGDRQEAEDIAQDAFVRVLERWERVGGLEDPVGYLYRTAMNGYRSRTRRARVAVRRQPRDRSQVDGLEQAEERARLMRQLSRLDPHQRAVLVLTDLIGFTADETNRITGSTAGAVRTRASRARRALRSMEEEKDA
jgi:RNA polymerase sigma-70 factor (ECF subfamily)